MNVSPETLSALISSLSAWETAPKCLRFPDDRPRGVATAFSGGNAATAPESNEQVLFEHHSWPPRQWTVVTSAKLQGNIATDETYPAGVFLVNVKNNNESLTYTLDAATQALSVWGEQVRVSFAWDVEAITLGLFRYPDQLIVQAGLNEAAGFGTARRTRFVGNGALGLRRMPVPLGARNVGFLLGSNAGPLSALVGDVTWLAGSGDTAANVDRGLVLGRIPAADVAAIQAAGRPLLVPSNAAIMQVNLIAANVNLAAEFEIRP